MARPVNISDLREQSQIPAKETGIGTVKAFFEHNKKSMAAVLPRHVDAERLLKLGLSALRTTPKLMECTTESLMGGLMSCAQMGLEPNTPMGHAYLIPFRNKQANRTDVQVIIGYRGLIDLARRSKQIVSIAAQVVHQNDEFEYEYGLDEKLRHIPAEGDGRGDITHFYAVAKLVGGGHAFEVMTRAEVERIRDNSQNYKFAQNKGNTVWGKHFSEMGRKTAIRRLFKYLPVSIEMAQASSFEAKVETGESQELDRVLEGEFTVEENPYLTEEEETVEAPPTPTNAENAPEWPKIVKLEEGGTAWSDINGEFFDPNIHLEKLNVPTMNNDHTFRKRPIRSKKSEPTETQQRTAVIDQTSGGFGEME